MEGLNRQQRRNAQRQKKKGKQPSIFAHLYKPIIQAYEQANAIQLSFRRKNEKDAELIQANLKPLNYIANEQVTKWMVIIKGAEPGYEKAINAVIKIWEFPTLANCWIKEQEIINQYFGKGNTFKKMDKFCVVCLESKHLKFLWCCGINMCYRCEAGIKVKQCPMCRHPMKPQFFSFPSIQILRERLPNCVVVDDQLNGRSGGTSFKEQQL